jgi:hypothetical protein
MAGYNRDDEHLDCLMTRRKSSGRPFLFFRPAAHLKLLLLRHIDFFRREASFPSAFPHAPPLGYLRRISGLTLSAAAAHDNAIGRMTDNNPSLRIYFHAPYS